VLFYRTACAGGRWSASASLWRGSWPHSTAGAPPPSRRHRPWRDFRGKAPPPCPPQIPGGIPGPWRRAWSSWSRSCRRPPGCPGRCTARSHPGSRRDSSPRPLRFPGRPGCWSAAPARSPAGRGSPYRPSPAGRACSRFARRRNRRTPAAHSPAGGGAFPRSSL